eukprot:CAMPEP_0117426374 /NCGR_PEP_ID=MMETSP0758-20121206/6510_1 /TAXON_ID=63605 /ORGANISM="Percolomonas cosmopolitus, Strain AE-1 (ATCC 50343)" /LENGTH=735 /DNA_ID=CAMNT_0005211523 /DNA_START=144 /DNA_END=2351 /DNA_ORIENTATION=+
MSRGKDMGMFYADVVLNVICKALEVKKLIYFYLIHYAEQKPDEAILSINNFNKDLSDKNQFIRALALRVMSSIRVPIITQIVVMAIKQCARDMSPFVKKAAALAIPKAYKLDHELKEELTTIIEELLQENNTMVLGAAVFAFNEICPNNFELIHPVYRKLCRFLVDCDEWGQSVIIKMLTRYARTQFLSPFTDEAFRTKKFYSDDEDSDFNVTSEDEDEEKKDDLANPMVSEIDPDHRFLLRSTLPLLKTNNNSVVLAVASLYYHVAPVEEHKLFVNGLLRNVLHSREYQYVSLANIATIAKEYPILFKDKLSFFFVFSSDPLFIKKLKLEILTLLASEKNIHTILAEFKSYVNFPQKSFVAATIQAMCRVASNNEDVREKTLQGLLKLVGSPSENVVAQAVIAIRHLLQQSDATSHEKIIRCLATLINAVTIPEARASIIWMIGEYYDIIKDIAADALRILIKDFTSSNTTVKLQILSIATKIYMKDSETIEKMFQYLLTLGRFDEDLDIRDRVRLIRAILYQENVVVLREKAERIFNPEKPQPNFDSGYHSRSRFAISTLSHLVNHQVDRYEALPEFPKVQPDNADKRRVAVGEKDVNIKDDESVTTGGDRIPNEDDFYVDVTDEDTDGSYTEGSFYSDEGSFYSEDGEGSYYSDDSFYSDEEEEDTKNGNKKGDESDGSFYSDEEEDESPPPGPAKETKHDDLFDFGAVDATPQEATKDEPKKESSTIDEFF